MTEKHTLNTRRLLCPMPVIRTQDAVKKLAAGEWKRDPFYNKMRTEVYQSSNLQLKGISMGNNKPYVTINDQILTLGDVIAGHKLVEIQRNKVLLQKGADRFYLQLPEE